MLLTITKVVYNQYIFTKGLFKFFKRNNWHRTFINMKLYNSNYIAFHINLFKINQSNLRRFNPHQHWHSSNGFPSIIGR